MSARRHSLATLLAGSTLALGGCGAFPYALQSPAPVAARVLPGPQGAGGEGSPAGVTNAQDKASDVVLFALGLLETDYRFGGKNPEAGLDCSGMVSYVFEKSVDLRLAGSAADLARQGKPVPLEQLKPGDLVFFNTRNRSYSHVGIYIGDARFVHAPSTNGKVRIDRLSDRYYAQRFEAAGTFFE